jgi:cytochrome c556
MWRTSIAVAALLAGIIAVVAHPEHIPERQALMKRSGEQAKIGGQMIRGELPFEAARARVIFAVFGEKAEKLPGLFPEDTRRGDTRAAAAIWDKPAEWQAAIAAFAADTRRAGDIASLDSFKAAFQNVSRHCRSCHEVFRGPPRHHHH